MSFAAFFPAFTYTLTGFDGVARNHIDAALSLGAKNFDLVTRVYFPAALPSIFSGLKTSLGTAWFVLIVAELVGAQSGLGYLIQLNRLTLQSSNVVAGMIAIGLLGFLMAKILSYLESWVIRWER